MKSENCHKLNVNAKFLYKKLSRLTEPFLDVLLPTFLLHVKLSNIAIKSLTIEPYSEVIFSKECVYLPPL